MLRVLFGVGGEEVRKCGLGSWKGLEPELMEDLVMRGHRPPPGEEYLLARCSRLAGRVVEIRPWWPQKPLISASMAFWVGVVVGAVCAAAWGFAPR